MKLRVLAVQSGTVCDGMTDEQYFEKQIAFAEEKLKNDSVDLLLFPELMTGIYFGFVTEKRWFNKAEDFFSGRTTLRMLELSKKHNVQIMYTLFEKDGEAYYNTCGLVSPIRGIIGRYRKTHIPGGDLRYNECYEKYYFNGGNDLPVYTLDNGIKFAMMLCYDRSFPEVWRTYYLKGAEVICCAACTMGLRQNMFVTELQTRALESHSFVIALNRAGTEKTDNEVVPRKHFGSTLIAGPLGDIVSILDDKPWQAIIQTLDIDEVKYADGRLNWKRDRRPELYDAVTDKNLKQDAMFLKGN